MASLHLVSKSLLVVVDCDVAKPSELKLNNGGEGLRSGG
jgi:hypothetical protein